MTVSAPLSIVRSVAELRAAVSSWKAAGLRVAFVPTMGALHDGHLTLVRRGLELADRVVVSIFVNPTQFGPNEDYARYPRREAEDAGLLHSVGASLLFAPTVEEMYPQGAATTVHVARLTEGLCGAFRPGHFDGVATVVTKLLLQAQPDVALFGEKDYQQLQVIKTLVRDLDIPVHVEGVPTVREADGLALSSRNAYLTPEQRGTALAISKLLTRLSVELADGRPAAPALEAGRAELIAAGFDSVDYLELRAADDLAALDRVDRPARLITAARLGGTRLIDNMPVSPKG